MVIPEAFSFAETDAVDQTSMIEGVRNDSIFGAEHSFEETCIGVESTGVQNAIFYLVEKRDLLFELFVDVLSSANESYT